MEKCSTLAELNEHFCSRITELKRSIYLQGAEDDPDCAATLWTVDNTVHKLEQDLARMQTELRKQQEAAKDFEKLKELVLWVDGRASYALDNLPQRFSKAKPSNPFPSYESPSMNTGTGEPVSKTSSGHTPEARLADLRKMGGTLFVPSMEYISVEDFHSVPKYMKGRLKYEKVNALIDDFNKALAAKYQIMQNGKKKKAPETLKRQYKAFKDQENKDTTGLHFITDRDMTELAGVKLDPTLRAALTIFRHCGLVREIRGKGVVRYAIVI